MASMAWIQLPHGRAAQRNVNPAGSGMIAFEIYIDGRKITTAGVGQSGSLSATVTWVKRRHADADMMPAEASCGGTYLDVGGLSDETSEYQRWTDQLALTAGSEVCIKVVEIDSVDAPTSRTTQGPEDHQRDMKRCLRWMAEQTGWTLIVPEDEA